MEVLPGPTTAQGVARTKQPEKVETHGGAESTEGTEAHVKQSEKVETHGGAEGTGGTEAHVKQPEKVETQGGAEGTGGTEAHVTEAQTHEAPNTDVAKLVPKSAYLTILKASVNFHQDGHKRKFLIKDFGSLETSLFVAEVFAKKISQCRFEFDQVSKKPDLRKDFLMKFGWPEGKSCKTGFEKTANIHDGCFVQSRIPATGGRPFDHLHPLHHGGTMQKLLPDTPVRWVPCESEAKRWCDPRKEVRHTWTGSQMDWASDGSRGQGGID